MTPNTEQGQDPQTAAARNCVRRMADAAAAFRDALDASQRAKATFSWGDESLRTDWAYFPRDHAGLPLHEMDISQQKRAHALIACALSLPAYAKVCAIMALESVLNEIELRRGDRVRDPGRYFLSIFDEPTGDRWSWRLEGHHVCLNFTILGGELAASTPLFLGANPAEVRHGPASVMRPCGEEEDAARALLALLDDAQRAAAVQCEVAPPDFVLTNMPFVPQAAIPGEFLTAVPMVRRAMQPAWDAFGERPKDRLAFSIDRPLGLAGVEMNERQRSLLNELIDVYIQRLPAELAAVERERIDTAGVSAVHFAWAGSTERREGHYYRLQGPSFLVEYDNTQNDANHVHAVWRDPTRDFGRHDLRRHLAIDH